MFYGKVDNYMILHTQMKLQYNQYNLRLELLSLLFKSYAFFAALSEIKLFIEHKDDKECFLPWWLKTKSWQRLPGVWPPCHLCLEQHWSQTEGICHIVDLYPQEALFWNKLKKKKIKYALRFTVISGRLPAGNLLILH